MLRAVYVRTLKEGVTDDDYIAAWMPDDATRDAYPARVQLSHSTVDERETVVTLDFEGDAESSLEALDSLVHPDWRERVAAVTESTRWESVTEVSVEFGHPDSSGR